MIAPLAKFIDWYALQFFWAIRPQSTGYFCGPRFASLIATPKNDWLHSRALSQNRKPNLEPQIHVGLNEVHFPMRNRINKNPLASSNRDTRANFAAGRGR